MALTPAEKAAGRRFRDDAQAELLQSFEAEPPTYVVPNFLALYRHKCAKREGRSTALELKEIYVQSPGYTVIDTDPLTVVAESDTLVPSTAVGPQRVMTYVPPGRFGFIYRAGTCRGCGQTARSKAGRIVDGHERPPIHGRVARR